MADQTKQSSYLTSVTGKVNVSQNIQDEITLTEIMLTESLLTPGLQTTMLVQNKLNMDTGLKNLDEYYGKDVTINAQREIIAKIFPGKKDTFSTTQQIYRISNRELINYNIEQFQIDACDRSLIKDARTFMTKSWSCATASDIVSDVLNHCIQPDNVNIESSFPPKDYIAENLHPFQVVTQQAENTLSFADNDPSFCHFMTYQDESGDDIPTHNFRSLSKMAKQKPIFTFTYSGKATTDLNYAIPSEIMAYSFPCDFDMLSDTLNGVDSNGQQIFSLITFNKLSGAVSSFGPQFDTCGTTAFSASTNLGTAEDQNSCNTNVEKYLITRKARMGLLEQDKIALRLTVPFNPIMNVGKVITANFLNSTTGNLNYGSGDYLIVNMTHNIKMGGFGVTVMDCVSNTVVAGSTIGNQTLQLGMARFGGVY
jgi:hypothetical protein